eukprot:jgi/Picsp_1/2246/NSC_05710-R1_upf0420 protein c16orf58 homolog
MAKTKNGKANITFREFLKDKNGNLKSKNHEIKETSARNVLSVAKRVIYKLFLPDGFPSSVSQDYLSYQVYDSIQGFSSYVRGMLSNQSILIGLGVGKGTSSAVSASLSLAMRDFVSIVGSLCFTFFAGSRLDANAKQWRLVADILNDIGMTLDVIAPAFPVLFLFLALVGSLFRAIVGVAGNATRTTLTHHFALQGNSGDVASKEGSQETAVTLLGMIFGVILTRIENQRLVLLIFGILTAVHIYANILAMRALQISRLNRSRIDLLLRQFVSSNDSSLDSLQQLASPKEMAKMEPLFGFHFLRKRALNIYVAPRINTVSHYDLEELGGFLLAEVGQQRIECSKLWHDFRVVTERYCILGVGRTNTKKMLVFLSPKSKSEVDVVTAYCMARLLSWEMQKTYGTDFLRKIMESKSSAELGVATFLSSLTQSGWSLEKPLLLQGDSRLEFSVSMKSE